jgi:hypothetical protein
MFTHRGVLLATPAVSVESVLRCGQGRRAHRKACPPPSLKTNLETIFEFATLLMRLGASFGKFVAQGSQAGATS